jgi:hypothetical protein
VRTTSIPRHHAACLALVLSLALPACSAEGFQKFKEHGTAATIAATGGALAVAISGPAAIPIFAGAVFLAMLADAEMAPPEKVKSTIHVVQIPAPAKDGTSQKPRVDTFDTSSSGAKGNLSLPNPDLPGLPHGGGLPWWAGTAQLVREAFWLLVGAFLIGYVLNHPKAQKTIAAVAAWAWAAARARGLQVWSIFSSLAKPSSLHAPKESPPTAPPTASTGAAARAPAPAPPPVRDNGPAGG